MTLAHHPSDATLLAHAGGGLNEGLSLVVATHLAFCGACRRIVREVEAVGGVLLDDLAPAALAPDALERTLARLDAMERAPRPLPFRSASADGLLPEPLRAYLGDRLPAGGWRPLAPGLRQITVLPRSERGGIAKLLSASPGIVLPRHGHRGLELTLVLSGSFSDASERFAVGDVAERDEGEDHQPVVDAGETCICLIATEAPLRFSGWLGRAIRPFIGF